MPTGTTIATDILTILGLNEPGGTPSASDLTTTIGQVNVMLDGWSVDESLVSGVATAQYALTASTNPNPIGPAATAPFNVARPSRIMQAVFLDAGGTRRPLRIVPSDEYFNHGDLTATAKAPDELYFDNADSSTGAASIYLYPVPSVSGSKLELETWQVYGPLVAAVNYPMQQGLQDAIEYGGAWRMISFFGIVDATLIQKIEQLASKTEERYQQAIFGVLVKPQNQNPQLMQAARQQAAPAGR